MADNNKIGALWCKNKNGKDYFTGMLEIHGEKIPIVVFGNKKTTEKHPDWTIHIVQKQNTSEPAPF